MSFEMKVFGWAIAVLICCTVGYAAALEEQERTEQCSVEER